MGMLRCRRRLRKGFFEAETADPERFDCKNEVARCYKAQDEAGTQGVGLAAKQVLDACDGLERLLTSPVFYEDDYGCENMLYEMRMGWFLTTNIWPY